MWTFSNIILWRIDDKALVARLPCVEANKGERGAYLLSEGNFKSVFDGIWTISDNIADSSRSSRIGWWVDQAIRRLIRTGPYVLGAHDANIAQRHLVGAGQTTQVSYDGCILALQVAPYFLAVFPPAGACVLVASEVDVRLCSKAFWITCLHEGPADALRVICVLCVISDMDLIVLEPLILNLVV